MSDSNMSYLVAAHVLSALLLGGWIAKVIWQARTLTNDEAILKAQGAHLEEEEGEQRV